MSLVHPAVIIALLALAAVLVPGVFSIFLATFAVLPGLAAVCAGLPLLVFTLYLTPAPLNMLVASSITSIFAGGLAAFVAVHIVVGSPSGGMAGLWYL